MPFTTSQDYLEEFEQRKRNDPKFEAATQVNATDRFLKAIGDRLLDGGNVCINMFGPPNHGKSNAMRKLARIIIEFLRKLMYNVSMETDVKLTRTYGESLVKFAERSKGANWETPVIVIQDEKLRMTGANRIVATRNLMNNLDSFRVLIYCYLLCYCDYWKKVVTKESFANMGFLIVEAIDHDWVDAKQNRFMWWTREGPVGYLYVDFEQDNTIYDNWKIDEQRGTTSNLGAAGAHMTDFDALAKQILSRSQQTPELANRKNLKLRDFEGLVRLMHESGEIIASDSDEHTAAWWAWCKYKTPEPLSKISQTPEAQPEPLKILANGGEINKYTDEGFEDTVLQDLPEFKTQWSINHPDILNKIKTRFKGHIIAEGPGYFILERRTPQGGPSSYPDVVGVEEDASIVLENAKNYNWRPEKGDAILAGRKRVKKGEPNPQDDMKAELEWYTILSFAFPDIHFKVRVFAQHKITKQIFKFDILPEECLYTAKRILLPKLEYPPRLPPPNLSTEAEKHGEEGPKRGGETPQNTEVRSHSRRLN